MIVLAAEARHLQQSAHSAAHHAVAERRLCRAVVRAQGHEPLALTFQQVCPPGENFSLLADHVPVARAGNEFLKRIREFLSVIAVRREFDPRELRLQPHGALAGILRHACQSRQFRHAALPVAAALRGAIPLLYFQQLRCGKSGEQAEGRSLLRHAARQRHARARQQCEAGDEGSEDGTHGREYTPGMASGARF